MAKVLAALRQTAAVPASLLTESAGTVEVPFIEVGPGRSLAGSADVMATKPVKPAATLAPTPTAAPVTTGVVFRTLPTAVPPVRARFAPELVAYHAPGQPASAQYSDLLKALTEAAGVDPTRKVLLFTACRAEAGNTTVLLNLAITAARQGRRVLVVDANLRRPAVSARLGLDEHPGMTEILGGESTMEDALQTTPQDRLTVLPAGKPAALFADVSAVCDLLEGLAAAFDLVLVDGPHWDGRPGVSVLAGLADAVFLVVPHAEADSPPASDLVRTLPERGIKLAGCVLAGR